MSYGFKIIVEGDYACFTRAEFKGDRVSYEVPTPGAMEGMIKSVYWKPAIRYVIDKIIVYNQIDFINIKRNEVTTKLSGKNVKAQMREPAKDICIYTSDDRTQRASRILKNVKYGIQFHFELTDLQNEVESGECNTENKHAEILTRRMKKGKYFRVPCLGCSECLVNKIILVDEFDTDEISKDILDLDDVDLGVMEYKVNFDDHGIPKNREWKKENFSDKATTEYYRPHMINGVIDVQKWRDGNAD